ncbi:hypothetical protein [Acinetobacter bereziniae]|uniref:DUF7738 domain-containing protein n=1 Tax=Acinetobacter bereziniae TaxID=106648 RepID=UPI001250AE8D|nr:hypothetical protein [Acinetobacter bereziniae]MBJ9904261.1 hypothetical protein [Acinetobacter bereziniae]MCU4319254.1 hypothetical protein [Acinetobacter bereziniae]MCU4600343.1 hypothetical protein [Acinetobacter bereziniae]MDA3442828.1 hypothetical protein [Acinetobacter bereziniae]
MHIFQKKLALFLPLLLCISCSNGQSTTKQDADTEGFIKKINPQHQFKVHGCAINYNGTDLYMSSGVEPWLKALGKNYRVVESVDPINRINIYIYDDIGVRLVERIADKQIDSFRFRLERPAHDIRKETDAEIEEELKKPDTEQVRSIFKDAIEVDGVLVGAYPMHDEVRDKFRAETSVSYNYTAYCNDNQKGESFGIELSTSFNDPEVIDHMYFYNHLDTMTLEQKKQLGRRKDENGREICGSYMDIKTMSVVPSYCTQEELDDEKKQQSK